MIKECVEAPPEDSTRMDVRTDADAVRDLASFQAARTLISQIAAVERLLRIYEPDNATVLQAGDALQSTLGGLLTDSPAVEVRLWRDCVLVNGERLRCDISNFASHKHLLAQAERLEIEKIVIEKGITRDEIIHFFRLLDSLDSSGVSGSAVLDRISSEGPSHVTVTPALQIATQLGSLGMKKLTKQERAKRVFYAALGSAKEILASQTSQGAVSLRKAKRAVYTAVDLLLEDDSSLLALATIKDHDEYTFTHSVNVCIFSLAIGHRLGLHRNCLAKLGIAALFHDIGKTSVPTDVLNKVGVLGVDEWKTIRGHTVMGVRKITKMPRCNEHMLHSIVVAFQHHVNLDLSGYPVVPPSGSIDLFSRIARIADTFDAMTTERPYRNKVYSPYEAVRYLVSQAGPKFDPVLVKAFASAIGIFPLGTIIRLRSGEVGIVVRRSQLSGDLDRPIMRVILDGKGNMAAEGRLIDLGQTDARTGEFVHSIMDTLSSRDLGVNPRDYLLAESASA